MLTSCRLYNGAHCTGIDAVQTRRPGRKRSGQRISLEDNKEESVSDLLQMVEAIARQAGAVLMEGFLLFMQPRAK